MALMRAGGGWRIDGAGARGQDQPTPMREEPMGDVQKWIDELRAGLGLTDLKKRQAAHPNMELPLCFRASA